MTDIEQRLIEAARAGEWLVCDEPGNVVRAGLIRELLLGRHGELDPRGVRLRGARIEGTLNLDRVQAVAGLTFRNCVINEPIKARSAGLPYLYFHGGSCAGIQADGLKVDGDLFLRRGVRMSGDHSYGTVRLFDAHVSGDLDLDGAQITNASGSALNASGLEVGGQVIFRDGVRIIGHGDESAVNFIGAHLRSNLDMSGTEISNDTGPAMQVDNAKIDGDLSLRYGNRITGRGDTGSLCLINARISGHVELTDTDITNAAGIALDAHGVQISGSLLLRNKLSIAGHDDIGAVDLVNARIGEILELANTNITNTGGPAINANRIRIGSVLALFGRTQLNAGNGPSLSLVSAHITGRLGCADTVELEASSESSPVLNLQDATVEASVRLPLEALCPGLERGAACEHRKLVTLSDFTYASLASRWNWEQWLHLIRCHTPAYHASAYQRLAAVERAAGHDGTVRRILMAQQTDLRRRSPQSLGGPLTRWFHWLWGVLAGYGYRARRTAAALLLVLAVSGAIGWWAGQVQTRPGHLVAERVTSATGVAGTPCSTVELIGLGLDRGLPLAMTGMRARCDLDSASKKGQAFTAAIWLVQLAVWGLATLALAGYTNLVRKPG
ncbi:hypothetical protein AB0M48_43250 [Lentzea sp. NPDC051208]|uniref:hypothetical protein n=1 Tax=Lentzea sp. NPDC051208 TaxID=3154642 RepID=UPI00342659C9